MQLMLTKQLGDFTRKVTVKTSFVEKDCPDLLATLQNPDKANSPLCSSSS